MFNLIQLIANVTKALIKEVQKIKAQLEIKAIEGKKEKNSKFERKPKMCPQIVLRKMNYCCVHRNESKN